MIYEVKVFTPAGDLIKVIPPGKIINRVWRSMGMSTASYREPSEGELKAAKAKFENKKRRCKYCPEYFIPRYENSNNCGSGTCKQRQYRALGAAPVVEKICPGCSKPFKGSAARKWCNNPCDWETGKTQKRMRGANEARKR